MEIVSFSPSGYVVKEASMLGTTMTYWSSDKRRWLLHSAFATPDDEAPQRWDDLLADPETPPGVFYAFIVMHPACEGITDLVVSKRTKNTGLDSDAKDDLKQAFQAGLWELFQRLPELRAWLSDGSPHFCGWIYKLNVNLGSREFRKLCDAIFGTDAFSWERLDDDQWAAQAARGDCFATLECTIDMTEILADLPELTRQILEMRRAGLTLDDIGRAIGKTRSAVKWALEPWRGILAMRLRAHLQG